MSSPSQRRERFHHLDGIRGIAALSVVIGHARWPNAIVHYGPFNSAGLWVDFFFVLSGFVIAYNYQERLADGFGLGTYMWKRLARIYPAHVAVLFMLLAYEFAKLFTQGWLNIHMDDAAFEGDDFWSFLASLGLVQALGMYPRPPWNGPAWSISTEVWTYLLFGLLFIWPKIRRELVVVATVAIVLLSYLVIVTNPEPQYLSVEAGRGFFRCLIGFGIGVLCYNVLSQGGAHRLTGNVRVAQLTLAALILSAMCFHLGSTPLTLAAPPIFGILIYLLTAYRGGAVERVLLLPPIQFLGMISYSLYISHTLLRKLVMTSFKLLSKVTGDVLSPAQLGDMLTLAYVPAALLLGWLVYRLVEVPANAWLTRSVAFARKGAL